MAHFKMKIVKEVDASTLFESLSLRGPNQHYLRMRFRYKLKRVPLVLYLYVSETGKAYKIYVSQESTMGEIASALIRGLGLDTKVAGHTDGIFFWQFFNKSIGKPVYNVGPSYFRCTPKELGVHHMDFLTLKLHEWNEGWGPYWADPRVT